MLSLFFSLSPYDANECSDPILQISQMPHPAVAQAPTAAMAPPQHQRAEFTFCTEAPPLFLGLTCNEHSPNF